jgi:hypothetical protein
MVPVDVKTMMMVIDPYWMGIYTHGSQEINDLMASPLRPNLLRSTFLSTTDGAVQHGFYPGD